MNKEYKAAIDHAVWNVLPTEINISNATVGQIHRKILAAIQDYLHNNPSQRKEEKQSATYDLEREIWKSVDVWYRKAEVDVRGDLCNRIFNIARAYAASLQAAETVPKPKEQFTAKDARSAVVKARTCEEFVCNIMQDIEYQAGYGFSDYSITTYLDDYKAPYLPQLCQYLIALGYSVVQASKQVAGRTRIKVTVSW